MSRGVVSQVSRRFLSLLVAFDVMVGAFVGRVYLGHREVVEKVAAQGAQFTFAAAGDWGWSSDTAATLDVVLPAGAAFTLALGDLSYNPPGTEPQWCDFVKSHVGPTHPFELLAGNHEDDGPDGLIDNFAACLPDRLGGLTGTYAKEYYFDYQGLARFILVAPNISVNGEYLQYTVGSPHYTWVASAIDGARAAGLPWVIVGMHKNCITIGTKTCEIGTDLMNLLVQKRVDLVLQGHEHMYQRSKQLAHSGACPAVPINTTDYNCIADDGADNVYVKGAGSVFQVIGTGGVSLYSINTSDPEVGYFAKWMGANIEPRYGLGKFTVTDTSLAAQFVGSTATSSFTDSFTITSAPGPTPTPPAGPTATLMADATIKQNTPTTNYGGDPTVKADNSPVENFLVKFDVAGLAGRPAASAKLRLYNTNSSSVGGVFKKTTDTAWTEVGVTWDTAPAAEAATLATLGSVSPNTWYEVDVAPAVTGDGPVSFRVNSTSTDGAEYSTKEGSAANKPQLVVIPGMASPTPAPTAQQRVVYADGLAAGWSDWSWGSVVNLANTSPVYLGATSISWAPQGWSGLKLHADTPFTASASNTLHLAMQASQPGQRFAVILSDGVAWYPEVPLASLGGDPPVGAWRAYSIPVTTLGVNNGLIGEVILKDITGQTQPAVYVDEIYFDETGGGVPTPTPTPTPTPAPTPTPVAGPTASLLADATIKQDTPSANYGSTATVKTDNSPVENFLVRFDVSGVGSQSVASAKLRLYNTNGSNKGGDIRRVGDNSWGETLVTWNNAPVADPTILSSLGTVSPSQWYEMDVTPAVTGDGAVSFRVNSTSTDGAEYSTKEGSAVSKPQLVIVLGAGPASSPGSSTTMTASLLADATIKKSSAKSNFGADTRLSADNSPVKGFLVKFDVSGVAGRQVTAAKLRLFNVNSSGQGGAFYSAANTWQENTVTWATAPPKGGQVGSLAVVNANNWYEVTVTPAVTGDGVYSFRVSSTSTDGAEYASKESTTGNAPQLVLTVQ